ncbi:MAG: cyclic pyranopterin monophosphate synthase MoaC [Myxococcales bacterium]|nr:cyclic pyranopterin monophosphate synthase MoaC [Myxococcales bacterium]
MTPSISTTSPTPSTRNGLTHVDETGAAHMVDVSHKSPTTRQATACAVIRMMRETLILLEKNSLSKGDAIAAARIAGIMAAKETSRLIPLCHPLQLTSVTVNLDIDLEHNVVRIEANVRCIGPTGVEMEALTAASVAALTLYDMAKGVDRTMVIDALRVVQKDGGISGQLYHDPRPEEPRVVSGAARRLSLSDQEYSDEPVTK